MPNFNHETGPLAKPTSPDASVSDAVNWYVNEGLQRRRAEKIARENRDYVGMSEVGDRCMRRVYFYAQKIERPQMTGERLRALEMGNYFELMTIDWMRAAGFDLLTTNSRGEQFEFSTANGRIKGHIDAALRGGPPIPGLVYPALWENKALKAKYWNAIVKHGLQKAEPKYWAQTQQYMAHAQVFQTLFTTINKDTAEIYHIVVPLVLADAQKYEDRGADIIRCLEKGTPPPRVAANKDYFVCKQCDLADYCWGLPT